MERIIVLDLNVQRLPGVSSPFFNAQAQGLSFACSLGKPRVLATLRP
jgi:hypothetical protein